jgi:acetyl esterase/lipase
MTGRGIMTREPPEPDKRVWYGGYPQKFIDLRFPKGTGPFPVLLVVHGGFWMSEYDAAHMAHLCARFTSLGVITCNVEYRRVGDAGGGWPGTFQDVAAAADYISNRMSMDVRFDRGRTVALGFSAGGHLALWLASRHKVSEGFGSMSGRKGLLSGVVSLAGLADLRTASKLRLGDGAVDMLMGGSPEEYPGRYRAASPIELLPTGVKQVLIHGVEDEIVPLSQSEEFAQRAKSAGDDPELFKLDRTGHFELADPESDAWPTVSKATLQLLRAGGDSVENEGVGEARSSS